MSDVHGSPSSGENPQAPAGWYPVDGGQQRYWDGTAWTDHQKPAPASGPAGPAGPDGRPDPSPFEPAPFAPAAAAEGAATTADERNLAVLIHVLSLFSSFIAPLVVWLLKRDTSAFVDHHGKEALNFQITLAIAWIVALFASLLLIGLLAIPFLLLAHLIFPILAAIAASSGRWYRYPLTVRLIS